MSYFSANTHDHGLIDFGCHSYGGLAYDANRHVRHQSTASGSRPSDESDEASEPSTSSASKSMDRNASKFITEHNLALYWRRAGLYPCMAGFAIPLGVDLSKDYAMCMRERSLGYIGTLERAQTNNTNRNLLAGELCKVFCVSDTYIS